MTFQGLVMTLTRKHITDDLFSTKLRLIHLLQSITGFSFFENKPDNKQANRGQANGH